LEKFYSRIFCRWCRVRRRFAEALGDEERPKISLDEVGKESYMPTDMVSSKNFFSSSWSPSTKLRVQYPGMQAIFDPGLQKKSTRHPKSG